MYILFIFLDSVIEDFLSRTIFILMNSSLITTDKDIAIFKCVLVFNDQMNIISIGQHLQRPRLATLKLLSEPEGFCISCILSRSIFIAVTESMKLNVIIFFSLSILPFISLAATAVPLATDSSNVPNLM